MEKIKHFGGQSMTYHSHIHPATHVCKRLFDITVSSIGLLIMIPIFPFIALAIKCNSDGPVFYRQTRVGTASQYYIKIFYMIKFRTMCVNAEANGQPQWAKKHDPRITSFGMFLRKTRLDELPQLVNVLKGEMSLVGPRPERPEFYKKLEYAIPFYSERTYGVLPGITGLAQVNQGYDETIEDVRSKLAYDHAYALSLSHPLIWIQFELNILFKTIRIVILGHGQ